MNSERTLMSSFKLLQKGEKTHQKKTDVLGFHAKKVDQMLRTHRLLSALEFLNLR